MDFESAYAENSVEGAQDNHQLAVVAHPTNLLFPKLFDPIIIEPDNDVLNGVELDSTWESETTSLVVIPNSGGTKNLAQTFHLGTPLAQLGIHDGIGKTKPPSRKRILKPLRMRVRHVCHHCKGVILQTQQCSTCGHQRCLGCIRYPHRRAISAEHGARLDRQLRSMKCGVLSTRIPTDDNSAIGRIAQKHLSSPQEKRSNYISRECTPDLILDSGISETSGSPLPFLNHIELMGDESFVIMRQLPDAVVEAISARICRQWQILRLHQQLGRYVLESSPTTWKDFEAAGDQRTQRLGPDRTSNTSFAHTYDQIVFSRVAVNTLAKERHHGEANTQPLGASHESASNTEQSVSSSCSSRAANQKSNLRKRTNDDDDQSNRKRQKALDQEASYTEPNILRCPYAAYDAARYSPRNTTEKDYRTCSACFLTSIPRLK